MRRNGVENPGRSFVEKLRKIDMDHRNAVKKIDKRYQITMAVIWFALGMNVAAAIYQIAKAAQ